VLPLNLLTRMFAVGMMAQLHKMIEVPAVASGAPFRLRCQTGSAD
jgi:hypothetical protein